SRVLPTPASPLTSSTPGSPATAASSAPVNADSSASRPTKTGLTRVRPTERNSATLTNLRCVRPQTEASWPMPRGSGGTEPALVEVRHVGPDREQVVAQLLDVPFGDAASERSVETAIR